MLIGLTGKKRVGKDTAASFLVNDYGFERVAFADKLKTAAITIFGFRDLSDDTKEIEVSCHVYDGNIRWALKQLGFETKDIPEGQQDIYHVFADQIDSVTDAGFNARISPRVAYQLLGTEFGRMYDKNFWVDRVDISFPDTVITDVRFDNEAEFIKRNGGHVIQITNDRIENTPTSTHVSESGVSAQYVDGVIINNDSLEHLSASMKELVKVLKR